MELENVKNPGETSDQSVELSEEELDEVVGGNDNWTKKWDGIARLDNNPASLISNPANRTTLPVNLPAAKEIGLL